MLDTYLTRTTERDGNAQKFETCFTSVARIQKATTKLRLASAASGYGVREAVRADAIV